MSSGAGTLGKYQIIREIARSNDIVYEAYDPAMNRRVALKELAVPHGTTDKQKHERLARFQREAKAAGSLTHPNIVTIYEVGEDNGRAFIAMEYLEGQNLRQQMDGEGTLAQEEAVRIILEVLEGLAYAHEKGVVHRDIKPDNIQLLPDDRVKITDFGIARIMFEPSLTMDGQIFGTPSYMSPEQVVGREIDARTDVWSCAVVLYESIAGKKPFAGDNVVSISHAIMHLEPPDPPGASFAISQVIRRALDKAPSERYANARAMAKALKEAMESLRADNIAPAPTFAQPTTYMPQNMPWGPPLDPYGRQQQYPQQPQPPMTPYGTPPPIPYGQPTPYGQQPYGHPYGAPQPSGMPLPVPLPPNWVAPPPRPPLLSPAAAQFLSRTLLVIVVGGALLALMIFGLYSLNEASQIETRTREAMAAAQSQVDEAAAIRNEAYREPVLQERARKLAEAVNGFAQAAEVAPTEAAKVEAYKAAGETAYQLALAYRELGEYANAKGAVQTAIMYADRAGASGTATAARQLQSQLPR